MPNVGDLERVSVTFTDSAGAVADPTTITSKYRSPAGVDTSNSYGDGLLLKDSTGKYHVDITVNLAGTWEYRFAGTGAVTAAAQSSFLVPVASLAP